MASELTLFLAKSFCNSPADATPQQLVDGEFKNIKALWETFNLDRAQIPRYLMNPKKQRSAYILGFHLPNIMRACLTWKRAENRFRTMKSISESSEPIHIFDIGCGTGAMTHAMILTLISGGIDPKRIKVTAIDQNKAFLEALEGGVGYLSNDIKTRVIQSDLAQWDHDRTPLSHQEINFVILGYVWNEVETIPHIRGKLERFLNHAMNLPQTFLQVSEPANQHIARKAMELRCFIGETASILYPCPNIEGCPMLDRSRDWCYSEFQWKPPGWMNTLDKKLGLSRSNLAGAGYIASSGSFPSNHNQDIKVVVGRPLIGKGKNRSTKNYELLLCSESGLSKTMPPKELKKPLLRGQLLRS